MPFGIFDRPRTLAVMSLSAGVVIAVTGPARAETCSEAPVSARGEPSKFEWLAKTKARANWRRRVRGTPGLGPDFAVWPRAANSEERCLTGPDGTVCIFTGTPCKP